MKRGKSRKSALWLMIGMLITGVLSSAVLAGENPWDSDKRPNQSPSSGGSTDSTLVSTTDAIRSVAVGGSAASANGFGWIETVNRVVYYFARNRAEWFRPSAGTRSSRSDRW